MKWRVRNNKNDYNETFPKIVVVVFKDIREYIFERGDESPENTDQK